MVEEKWAYLVKWKRKDWPDSLQAKFFRKTFSDFPYPANCHSLKSLLKQGKSWPRPS